MSTNGQPQKPNGQSGARPGAAIVPVASGQNLPAKQEAPPKIMELLKTQRSQIGSLLVGEFTGPEGEKRRDSMIDRTIRLVGLELAKPGSRLPACNPWTIVTSVQEAARLNLEIGGAMGHAYLVPYKDVCQLQVGYRGLAELAMRSGKVKDIQAHIVYEGDRFHYQLGDDPKIEHMPDPDGPGRQAGKWTHAYCVVRLTGGGVLRDVMTKLEVMKAKAISPSASSSASPWSKHETEMARKTVTRRALKYAPMSTEVADVLLREDQYSVESAEPIHEVPRGNAGMTQLARAQMSQPAPIEPNHEEREPIDEGPSEEERAAIAAQEREEAGLPR